MERKEKIITTIIMVPVIIATLIWAGKRDQEIMLWGRAYDACVMREYGTTAIAWNYEHGEYPVCNQ